MKKETPGGGLRQVPQFGVCRVGDEVTVCLSHSNPPKKIIQLLTLLKIDRLPDSVQQENVSLQGQNLA